MRAMRAITFLVASLSALGFQGAAQESTRKEMAHLEGEWKMISGKVDGESLSRDLVAEMRRVAKNGEVTITLNGRVIFKSKFTIDPTKSPKTIDETLVEGPNKGKIQVGIYELECDVLKFCTASPAKNRPSDFTAGEGSGRTLSVWKRVK